MKTLIKITIKLQLDCQLNHNQPSENSHLNLNTSPHPGSNNSSASNKKVTTFMSQDEASKWMQSYLPSTFETLHKAYLSYYRTGNIFTSESGMSFCEMMSYP